MDVIEVVRWLHMVATLAWLGAVLTVVSVLVPAAVSSEREQRVVMLTQVFPRVFRLASVLVALSFASGAALFLHRFGAEPSLAFTTSSGRAILAGGALGLAVGTFHFIVEPKLEQRIGALSTGDATRVDLVVRRLMIIPRVGLAVLVVASLLMVSAARS